MDKDMVRWWLKIWKVKPNFAKFQISNNFCFIKSCNIFVELYWRVHFLSAKEYILTRTKFKQDGCRRRRHFHNEISRERFELIFLYGDLPRLAYMNPNFWANLTQADGPNQPNLYFWEKISQWANFIFIRSGHLWPSDWKMNVWGGCGLLTYRPDRTKTVFYPILMKFGLEAYGRKKNVEWVWSSYDHFLTYQPDHPNLFFRKITK